MERFWRTLREGLLDFDTGETTLDALNERLQAFLDARYHKAPHAGLLGRSPSSVYSAHQRTDDLTEQKLEEALTVRATRRVSADSVISVDGIAWELDQGFLAGKTVTVVQSWLDPKAPPAVEIEGKRFPLHRVDPAANAKRKRPRREESLAPRRGVAFDPAAAVTRAAKREGGDA